MFNERTILEMEGYHQDGSYYRLQNERREFLVSVDEALPLLVPRRYIFGTQLTNEYLRKKAEITKKKYAYEGINYIVKNPPIACAVGNRNSMMLTLLDGHNRVRYIGHALNSKDYSLDYSVPLFVLNVSTVHRLFNVDVNYLNACVAETLRDFDRNMQLHRGSYVNPEFVTGETAEYIWQYLYLNAPATI